MPESSWSSLVDGLYTPHTPFPHSGSDLGDSGSFEIGTGNEGRSLPVSGDLRRRRGRGLIGRRSVSKVKDSKISYFPIFVPNPLLSPSSLVLSHFSPFYPLFRSSFSSSPYGDNNPPGGEWGGSPTVSTTGSIPGVTDHPDGGRPELPPDLN